MLLTLSVTDYRGEPPALPFTKTFHSHGGTIGRGSDADWVLRDPDVSRLHATIECRAGDYYVIDNSKNGVFVNDAKRPLGQGKEHKLIDGDRLIMGDYVVQVSITPDELELEGGAPSARDASEQGPPLRGGEFEGRVRKPEWFSRLSLAPDKADQPAASDQTMESASERLSVLEEHMPPPKPVRDESLASIPPEDYNPLERTAEKASAEAREQDYKRATPEPGPLKEAWPAEIEALQMLFAAMGVPNLHVSHEHAPEVLRTIGEILREALQGTMDVLRTREKIKAGFEVPGRTRLERVDNNPLKFSASVEELLTRLLTQEFAGYMPPLPAIRQAFRDIVAHELAVVEGMRAAFRAVLETFEPAKLEERLQRRSVIDEVLPGHRKAKTWDLFTELYEEIAREAADDFQRLFGEQFARAYLQQIEKLRSGGFSER